MGFVKNTRRVIKNPRRFVRNYMIIGKKKSNIFVKGWNVLFSHPSSTPPRNPLEINIFLKDLCFVFVTDDLYLFVHNNNLIIRYICCYSLREKLACDCHWLFQREHGQQIYQEEECYWSNTIISNEFKMLF